MTKEQEQPLPLHVLWLKILLLAYERGHEIPTAIEQADGVVTAYRQRLAKDGKEVTRA
jgi:hypothetical protein